MKKPDPAITSSQQGLGDMDPAEFRRAAHAVADEIADYLEHRLERYSVLPEIEPGAILGSSPPSPRIDPSRSSRSWTTIAR